MSCHIDGTLKYHEHYNDFDIYKGSQFNKQLIFHTSRLQQYIILFSSPTFRPSIAITALLASRNNISSCKISVSGKKIFLSVFEFHRSFWNNIQRCFGSLDHITIFRGDSTVQQKEKWSSFTTRPLAAVLATLLLPLFLESTSNVRLSTYPLTALPLEWISTPSIPRAMYRLLFSMTGPFLMKMRPLSNTWPT